MPVIDIIVCAILAIAVLVGLFRGFYKCIIRFLLAVIALVAAIAVASMLVGEIEFIAGLQTTVSESLIASFDGMGLNVVATDVEAINGALAAMGIPAEVNLGGVLVGMVPADLAVGTTFSHFLAGSIANIAVTAVVAIVLYIVFRIVLSYFGKLLQLTHKDVIMRLIDRVLGIVWCVAIAAVIIFALLGAISAFGGELIPAEMMEGPVTTYIQSINPFTEMFKGMATPAA